METIDLEDRRELVAALDAYEAAYQARWAAEDEAVDEGRDPGRDEGAFNFHMLDEAQAEREVALVATMRAVPLFAVHRRGVLYVLTLLLPSQASAAASSSAAEPGRYRGGRPQLAAEPRPPKAGTILRLRPHEFATLDDPA